MKLRAQVFEDPFQINILDRIENGEERWQTLGMVGSMVLLLVAHTFVEQEEEEVVRIISARKATRKERQKYEERTLRKLAEEMATLAAMPDEEIDTSDIPEITDWSKAVVGRFYRPVKETVTIRLDADVLDWRKEGGRGYQTRVNTDSSGSYGATVLCVGDFTGWMAMMMSVWMLKFK